LGSSEPTVRLLPLGESERNLQQSSQLGSLRARERMKERQAEASGVSPLSRQERDEPASSTTRAHKTRSHLQQKAARRILFSSKQHGTIHVAACIVPSDYDLAGTGNRSRSWLCIDMAFSPPALANIPTSYEHLKTEQGMLGRSHLSNPCCT
jgi:hypothetical protein